MFGEDLFKDAKYCIPCNKFYVTNQCPFCTPKKESRVESQELGVRTLNSGLKTQDTQLKTQNPQLDSKVEELSSEVERLRRENKEKREQIAKEKELELKFNILADKFERLSQKGKEYREQTPKEPPMSHWSGREDVKIKRLKGNGVPSIAPCNGKDAQTAGLKDRIKELTAELERLEQRNEEKDLQVLKSVADASKLTGVAEQQKDELERLRFDIQERDRVIMQISLTLSSAISQALVQREREKLQEFTTPHSNLSALGGSTSDTRGLTIKRNKRPRKTLYAVLGCLNAIIIGYFGWAFLYKKGILTFIIESFLNLFGK